MYQGVLYLDNCVFSKMFEPEYQFLKRAFLKLPHRVAFSHVHLNEMKGNHEAYSELLCELDAVFIVNSGASGACRSISSLEIGDPFQRFSQHLELAAAEEAMMAMLLPFQHLLGGARDKGMQTIADASAKQIEDSLVQYLSESGIDPQNFDFSQLDEVSKNLKSIDVQEFWNWGDVQFTAARSGDPMRDMSAVEKVNFLFSLLLHEEREALVQHYPVNFARERAFDCEDLIGFSFLLFQLGLTKRKGIFSGKHQERKFKAQFQDVRHIEAASRCNAFITFDKGAFELASVIFGYSGISTETTLL